MEGGSQMLEQIGTDIWSYFEAVFLSGDWVSVGMAAAIAIIAGLLMSSFGHIINTTFGALVVYGIAEVVYGVVTAGADTSTESALTSSWEGFAAISMGVFLVYFVAFFVVITIFHIIRSAVGR